MKQVLKEGIRLKGQTVYYISIVFLTAFLSAYLFSGLQTAFSKNIKALDGDNNHIQKGEDENSRYLYNKWYLCNNNDVSPKDLKITAIERLSSLKDNKESLVNPPDKKILSEIDNAIFHINKSLKENLWRDSRHLHWAEGALVFNAEGTAAQCFKRIMTYDNETVENIVTEALHNLVSADYILAMTVLNEAQSYTNISEEIEIQIRKSKEYLQSGKNSWEDSEKAIEYFRKSWHFASLALTKLPTVSINISPETIPLNGTATLTWVFTNADSIFIDNGIGEVEPSGSIDISPTQTTTYTITAINSSGAATDTVTITVIRPPSASISIDPLYIHTGCTATLTWTTSNADTVNIDNGIGEVDTTGSINVSPSQTTTYTITATNSSGTATDTITIKVIHMGALPEGSFGKQYEGLIPEDATIEAYDEKRFCIITGFVYTMDETGEKAPFPHVTISLHNHPQYGTAQTNEEGRFAIPADGGGIYTIVYEKEGYIQAQRKVKTFWSEVVLTKDDPILIQKDTKTTQVLFDGNPDTVIVHESTPVIDERGARSCTLVFTGDNKAYTSDGTELYTITTSVTEYTTPGSMPAILPPYTQFTYCAEFSAQEAEDIRFEKSVIAYVDDFMNFGTGGIVPVGFYDRDRALWVPCRNGLIVTFLDTNGDTIVDALDADGDGMPDDINNSGSFTDDALGLDDPDRYQPDTTYWRIELDHFSPGDLNWPMSDYPLPDPPAPPAFDTQQPKDCKTHTCSYTEHRSRILHEDIPVPGTDWTLHYASNRTSGYEYRITVPVTDNIPFCNAISVCVEVAGRRFKESFLPRENEKTEFTWNGLDFMGNEMYGAVPVEVDITYHYERGTYMIPVVNRFGDIPPQLLDPAGGLFGWPGSGYYTSEPGQVSFRPASSGVSSTVIFPRTLSRKYYIHVQRKPKEVIAQGWTISSHHSLVRDPVVPSALYKGDGTILKNQKIIKTIAGTGMGGYNGDNIPSTQARLNGPIALATDSEGNLYILQERQKRVRKVDTNGIVTTIAGGGSDTRNGVPAIGAQIHNPKDIALDNEGNIYIIDHHSIRKVDINGIITTIVNIEGRIGYHGDGGPATDAWLYYPTNIACDSNGNIYIADSGNNRVRMVNTNGIINTIAGNGMADCTGDKGPAIFASVTPWSIDVDSLGNIYILDSGSKRIRKMSPGGIITTFADLDLPHISSAFYKIAIDSRDNLYFVDLHENVIKIINRDGEMMTVAGNGDNNHGGDSGAPRDASFSPMDVAIGPVGDIYIADWWHERVRKISRSFVFASDSGILVPDDGGIGYIMDPAGRHLSTIDLHTRKTLLSFEYDRMSLISIRDRFGNETRINRDSEACPLSIISPHGIVTPLSIDMYNNLRRVTYPDGSHYDIEYTPDGLMTDKYDPKGNHFEYLFDAVGKLTDVFDPEGGHWNYQRTMDPLFDILTIVTTGEGNTTTYRDHRYSSGYYISNIISPTGDATNFAKSADGLVITKELPCGISLWFKYGIDPQSRKPYIQNTSETTPSGLTRGTFTEKTYTDTNGDGFNDLITTSTSINGKTIVTVDNTIEGVETSTSPHGRTVINCYDPDTLLTKSTNVPGLYETSYGYDARGRLTSVNTYIRSTGFTYNAQGLLESITSPENQTTQYTYDTAGRITGIIRPDGSSVGFTYDQNGNITLITTPSLIDHGFSYNGVNLNTYYQTPISGTYSYMYNKDRRLVQTNFPSGRRIKNIYDRTRLIQIQTPEGEIDFNYLCGDKVEFITMGAESITYGYDGKLIKQETLSGTLNETLSYTYNNDFNPASFTYAGDTVSYSYDDDGLLTSAGNFTISRNAQNGLPEVVTDGTSSIARTYNGYGEIEKQDFTVNGNNIFSWGLVYDNAGRIAQKTEMINGTSSIYTYTYDPVGQLLTVSKDGSLVEEYRYGPNGNRIYEMNVLRGISGRGFTYSDEDHLLTLDTARYYYTLDGFLNEKIEGEDITKYNYSSRGELLDVMLPDGRLVEYIYDPLGRRIAKKVDGVVTEKYLWKEMTLLLAVYDGSDNLLMRFEYTDARIPVSMRISNSTYYLWYDHIGSLRIVANAFGNMVKKIDYDSFGNIINDTNPAFIVLFGFAGGMYDRDTGLLRFGYRDYDANTGRWLAHDPIGFLSGDLNLYRYVRNNPINWIDPKGKWGIGFKSGGSINFFGFRFVLDIEARLIHESKKTFLDLSSWSGGLSLTESHSNILQREDFSLTLGVEADLGTGWLITNASNINQILGYSETQFGASGGWVYGGGVEYTHMTDNCGNKTKYNGNMPLWEISIGHPPFPGVNFGFESHTGNTNKTIPIWIFGS